MTPGLVQEDRSQLTGDIIDDRNGAVLDRQPEAVWAEAGVEDDGVAVVVLDSQAVADHVDVVTVVVGHVEAGGAVLGLHDAVLVDGDLLVLQGHILATLGALVVRGVGAVVPPAVGAAVLAGLEELEQVQAVGHGAAVGDGAEVERRGGPVETVFVQVDGEAELAGQAVVTDAGYVVVRGRDFSRLVGGEGEDVLAGQRDGQADDVRQLVDVQHDAGAALRRIAGVVDALGAVLAGGGVVRGHLGVAVVSGVAAGGQGQGEAEGKEQVREVAHGVLRGGGELT